MNIYISCKQRFTSFNKAALQLKEFIEKGELDKFAVRGLIQCFEHTFELARKTIKDYLQQEGFDVRSPRKAIQMAFQIQLIIDGHGWIDALEQRNLMEHTYDESRAKEAEELIKTKYYKIIQEFCTKMGELL